MKLRRITFLKVLKKPPRRNDVSIEILWTLLETDTPLTSYRISKKIGRSIQLIDYHLQHFVKTGVVEFSRETGFNLFYLKPTLYDKKLFIALKSALIPLVRVIAKECKNQDQVIEILNVALMLFTKSLSKEFLDSSLNREKDIQ